MSKQQSFLLLEAYREYLVAIKGASDNTVETYDIVVGAFINHIGNVITASQEDIEDYMCHLCDKGLKASTQAHHLSTLKTFYEFLLSKRCSVKPMYLCGYAKGGKTFA